MITGHHHDDQVLIGVRENNEKLLVKVKRNTPLLFLKSLKLKLNILLLLKTLFTSPMRR